MNIASTFDKDIRTLKKGAGAYEWWYFDAVSDDGSIEIVIIFYEGNPFSRRYIQHQQNGAEALAGEFPAVSISVYKHHKPLYYSFTEFSKNKAHFSDDCSSICIGDHQMEGSREDGKISYTLRLKEKLASGDAIVGELLFESSAIASNLFAQEQSSDQKHSWNLVQPKADVTGAIRCYARNEEYVHIQFKGSGYHDHNMGKEPLKQEFKDWYWGRFHFERITLVYYVMGEGQQDQFGWLISNDHQEVIQTFDKIKLEDISYSLYGLRSARKLILSNDEAHVMVQQSNLLDNGPFYQRFSSDAFLNMPEENVMQTSSGITEYLCPLRIYKRLYWPLTNMRIRYQKEAPHWVQRSKILYRWTW